MDIAAVIQELTEEKGLDRDRVLEVISKGILSAYKKKFPKLVLEAEYNKKTNSVEVFVVKKVVSEVTDPTREILFKQAKVFDSEVELDFKVRVLLEEKIGRVEITSAKGVIAAGIRALEEEAVFKEFIDKRGQLVSGTINKKEGAGFSVNLGEVFAFLPNSNSGSGDNLRIGFSVRALLGDVLEASKSGYQLILDRSSADFLKKLMEAEIPEVFDGTVEIKAIKRVAGYKSKVAVVCSGREVDPVGTCVGVGGSRIKPILKELGGFEKVDLISWKDDPEDFVRESLSPAKVNKVRVDVNTGVATVWLDEDQRSVAIGRMGQNIALASRLTGLKIDLFKPDAMEDSEIS